MEKREEQHGGQTEKKKEEHKTADKQIGEYIFI
jgi:hypothetical protein